MEDVDPPVESPTPSRRVFDLRVGVVAGSDTHGPPTDGHT